MHNNKNFLTTFFRSSSQQTLDSHKVAEELVDRKQFYICLLYKKKLFFSVKAVLPNFFHSCWQALLVTPAWSIEKKLKGENKNYSLFYYYGIHFIWNESVRSFYNGFIEWRSVNTTLERSYSVNWEWRVCFRNKINTVIETEKIYLSLSCPSPMLFCVYLSIKQDQRETHKWVDKCILALPISSIIVTISSYFFFVIQEKYFEHVIFFQWGHWKRLTRLDGWVTNVSLHLFYCSRTKYIIPFIKHFYLPMFLQIYDSHIGALKGSSER